MSHQAKLGSDAVAWILPALASFSYQHPIKAAWAASKGTSEHIPIYKCVANIAIAAIYIVYDARGSMPSLLSLIHI